MLYIKKLHLFILKSFLPLLIATFGICLFILLMQFLWKYVDDMVGKGIDMLILAKMFFYAAVTLVPMALPLSILLASLMTFGNLGEHLELLAIKSAGVSLLKIMRPIIVALAFIVGLSFYFQNNVLPVTQVKLWTLVISVKQKSPELDIPEGIFYKDIPGYSVYVKHKDKKGGMLRNLMIYDFSEGFENARVIVADSGRIKSSEDKSYLVITLYSGESFQNMGKEQAVQSEGKSLYSRETFVLKEIVKKYDSSFNMADESIMQGRDVSKNLNELSHFVDSVNVRLDSITKVTSPGFRDEVYRTRFLSNPVETASNQNTFPDTVVIGKFDDYMAKKTMQKQLSLANQAKSKLEGQQNSFTSFEKSTQVEDMSQVRGHLAEYHRKFSLSIACLLFFFIGAPLGAIIRKGGLGMPVVIAVFVFLSYYIIDVFGMKMAKQNVWLVWQGMWLSTFVLLSLGVFFTYKAVNDSVILNPDAWKDVLRRFFGKRELRNYHRKEVIMTPPDYAEDLNRIQRLDEQCADYLKSYRKRVLFRIFDVQGKTDEKLEKLILIQEELIEDLRNSPENLIIGKVMDYPIIKPFHTGFLSNGVLRWVCIILFPAIGSIFLIKYYRYKQIWNDIVTTRKVNRNLEIEIQKFVKI